MEKTNNHHTNNQAATRQKKSDVMSENKNLAQKNAQNFSLFKGNAGVPTRLLK